MLPGQGVSGRVGGTCRDRGTLTEDAVVVTVAVTFVPELLGVTEDCESEHVASEGPPLHDRVTAWSNPPRLAAVRVYVAAPPGETVADEEDPVATARLKS